MATLTSIHPPRRYERGGVSWVTLLLLLSVATFVYLTVTWLPIYFVHYEVKQTVRDYMNQAIKDPDDERLIQNLCLKLKVLDSTTVVGENGKPERVPTVVVAPEEVTWERDKQSSPPMLRVSFEYKREIRYPFLSGEPKEWIGRIDLSNDLTIPDWGPQR